jgi:AraC-like DNA-binding protein
MDPAAREAFLLRAVMDPPWSMRIRDDEPLTVVSMVSGTAWVLPDDAAAVELGPGDVAVVRGPDHYTVTDAPGTPPDNIIHPGQRCETRDGRGATIGSVAHEVGYGSPFALSTAFKRVRGISPQQHRLAAERSAARRSPEFRWRGARLRRRCPGHGGGRGSDKRRGSRRTAAYPCSRTSTRTTSACPTSTTPRPPTARRRTP